MELSIPPFIHYVGSGLYNSIYPIFLSHLSQQVPRITDSKPHLLEEGRLESFDQCI